MERICISLPKELYQAVLADAERLGISISAAARLAIKTHYEQTQVEAEKGGEKGRDHDN